MHVEPANDIREIMLIKIIHIIYMNTHILRMPQREVAY